jgi:hypothetical protein
MLPAVARQRRCAPAVLSDRKQTSQPEISAMKQGIVTILIACTAFAMTARGADEPPVYQLVVHARGEPTPALRYRLTPSLAEITPGNAAPVYLSGLLLAPKLTDEQKDQLAAYEAMPPGALPHEEAARFIEPFASAIDQFDVAARREFCRWDMPVRERAFLALLPHLQGLREMSRVLALRARLQMAEGKYDDAAATLATGFAMAHHTAENGVLIEALVSAACVRHLCTAVRQWQQSPDSPNLFWSIAELPRPFIDGPSAMRRDNVLLYMGLPGLGQTRNRKISTEQWRNIVEQAGAMARGDNPDTAAGIADALKNSLDAAALLPKARAQLLKQGRPQAVIDGMQPLEIVAIYQIEQYEQHLQDLQKWFGLPFWQASAGLADAMKRFDEAHKSEANALFAFVPAMSRAFAGCVAADRELAAIQTIEAVRGFAAAHQGKLPTSLDELADFMPTPIDPMTGKPFDYVPGDVMFSLAAEPIDGRGGFTYEVTVK